jgi:hypothetical protein
VQMIFTFFSKVEACSFKVFIWPTIFFFLNCLLYYNFFKGWLEMFLLWFTEFTVLKILIILRNKEMWWKRVFW